MFGRVAIAAKLESQDAAGGELDWRLVKDTSDLGHELIDIPSDVHNNLMALLNKMGLVYASVDFIVTDKGAWVFFEIYEMGNFLWIENQNPTIYLVDTIVEFIRSRNNCFEGSDVPPALRLKLSDFDVTGWTQLTGITEGNHIAPKLAFSYRE